MFSLSHKRATNGPYQPIRFKGTVKEGTMDNVLSCIMYVCVGENKQMIFLSFTVSTCIACIMLYESRQTERASLSKLRWLLFDFVQARTNQSKKTLGRQRLNPHGPSRHPALINGVRAPPAHIYQHVFRSHLSSRNSLEWLFQTKWCQATPTI